MKKILIFTSLLVGSLTYGQVKLQTGVDTSIGNQNPFLDASGYINSLNNIGKGLYFPQTDLTVWEFEVGSIDPETFATYFDGMIVYNKKAGKTVADPNKGGIQVDVEKGFYYFFNPDQSFPTGSVANGRWVRLDGGTSSSSAADYKKGPAVPTGEFFWPDDQESNKKPIMRKTLEVVFDDATYTNVTSSMLPETAVFVKTQLVDKNTGKMLLASAEFKPNGGDEFGVAHTEDFFVAKYGEMSTTLNGTYTLILEYYVP